MIIKVTRQLLYPFSRSQNFFEMNPVYPDLGEVDFDVYNTKRKMIPVVETNQKFQTKQQQFRDLIRKKIYLKKYERFKKYKKSTNTFIDEETNLVIGVDADFDEFIKDFKANKLITKNAKSQFKAALLKLVRKFECKSEPELIRLFRISLANLKKKTLLDKMRGTILEEALMNTSSVRRINPVKDAEQYIKEVEEVEFEKILKELDEKILQAENALRFNEYGLPHKLSDYDPKYGWKMHHEVTENQYYDLTVDQGYQSTIEVDGYEQRRKFQDESIRARINRFYFLRRLQFLKNQEFKYLNFAQELPINLKERQNIMNQLAYKYKEESLIQEPDLEEIYQEVDVVIDKVFIKVKSGNTPKQECKKGEQLFDHAPDSSSYLWDNIDVEEILCSQNYNYDTLKSNDLTYKSIKDTSPNPDIQTALSSFPMNLYRHTEFQVFGIFNGHKIRTNKQLINVEQHQFQPQYKDFTIQEASKKYEKLQKKMKEGLHQSRGYAQRKTAESQAFITKGTGIVTVNGKPIQDYFGDVVLRVQALKPLVFTDTSGLYDIKFNVVGSGNQGQAQCMAYALSRALIKINPQHKTILCHFGLTGNDTRVKQAKKTNLYSARVRPPYVRR